MAAGYNCDSDDGNQAGFLLTNLANGDVAAYCVGCLPSMLRAIADAIDGGTSVAESLDDSVTDPLVASVQEGGGSANGSPPKRRPRKAPTGEESPAVTVPPTTTADDE